MRPDAEPVGSRQRRSQQDATPPVQVPPLDDQPLSVSAAQIRAAQAFATSRYMPQPVTPDSTSATPVAVSISVSVTVPLTSPRPGVNASVMAGPSYSSDTEQLDTTKVEDGREQLESDRDDSFHE
ncbi:hypothetical protein FRB96_006110 [Tulasnella sp. 330]|nr:hypothetical protein FRB96_006110 [Tulasnella sp. 330]KAG8889496.1 hypothetical protein FRB98_003970 [Tulasnella sp. 332]